MEPDTLLSPFYVLEHQPGVHIARRTNRRATVPELARALRAVPLELASMPSARGIVMDTRAAPPTQDAEEFERQIIPVLTSLFVQYRRCSILVGSRVAVLHSRRLSNSFETVETFMDDLDAAIAYAKS